MASIPRHAFRRIFAIFLLIGASAAAALAQAPSGLTVQTATRDSVQISWTGAASSYRVQRRALGTAFADLATVSATTYTDTQIDPYTTYQYQIVAAQDASAASNAVTVGPPPAGFSVAAPAPGGPGTLLSGSYGYDLSMTLDANGDPAFTFLFQDPNQDTDLADTTLLFRSWNRAQYRWNDVATVGIVGDSASTFYPTLSLAYDAGANVFAIASEFNLQQGIKLFTSADGGLTWTLKTTLEAEDVGRSGPSLALAAGNLHLAYLDSIDGAVYVTGTLSADPATWTRTVAPIPPGADSARYGTAPSLALDSDGAPGVAYFAPAADVDNTILFFWHPTQSGGPVRALDSQGQGSDEVAVKLRFYGLNPRVAVFLQRTDADFGVGLHFARSEDGGATWLTPVVIPPDGDSSTDYPFDLALDSQDHGAIAFGQNGSSGNDTCGYPKLARSNDLTSWTTCAAAPRDITKDYSVYPASLQLAFGGNDKLFMAWQETYENPTGSGILLWREPPAGASTAPTLDPGSAVNGATYQPGLVPGSWAQVKGANLAGVTRIWGDADFPDYPTLPTILSGVEVRVNNLPAAVYYISPTQVSFQVPAGVSGDVSVQVIRDGEPSNTITGSAVDNAPGMFGYAAGSKTYPAAVFPDGLIVGDPGVSGNIVRKAKPGDHIQLYATALAPTPAGVAPTAVSGLPGVTVEIGGQPATVEFSGLVAVGEFQINVIVPDLDDGDYPVIVKYAGRQSQDGVVLPVAH